MTYNWSAQVYSTQVTVVHGMVRFTGHESEYTKSKDLTLLYNEPILIYIYVCVCVSPSFHQTFPNRYRSY